MTPTPTQLIYLRARCETGSQKAAAARLRRSERTVRWHLSALLEATGCRDVAEACWRFHAELVAVALPVSDSTAAPTARAS